MTGFSNAVLGGVDILKRKAIQSVNFVHGVSGWRINRDGSAEFNSITVPVGTGGGNRVFAQPTAPVGANVNDLWINTSSVAGNVFSSAGSPFSGNTASFQLQTTAIDNFIVCEVIVNSATQQCTGMASSAVNWSQLVAPTLLNATSNEMCTVFIGRVTAVRGPTNPDTVTLTISGAGNPPVRVAGTEGHATAGFASISLDTSGTVDTTTNNFPSLGPAGSGEFYFGFAFNQNVATVGNTTGYTYFLDPNGNGACFNPSCGSGAQSPVWGDNPADDITGIAVLLKSTAGTSQPPSNQISTWNGSAWVPYQFGTGALGPGSITAALIAAGTIVAGIIDGTEVNAATFNGATFNGLNFILNNRGAFFYSGQPGNGNLVLSVAGVAGTDAFGNSYPAATEALMPFILKVPGSTPAAVPGAAVLYSANGDLQVVDGADGQAYVAGRRTVVTGSNQLCNSGTFATFVQSTVSGALSNARTYRVHGRLDINPNQAAGGLAVKWLCTNATTPSSMDITWSSTNTATDKPVPFISVAQNTSLQPGYTMANAQKYSVEIDGTFTLPAATGSTFQVQFATPTAGDNYTILAGSFIELEPV